MEICYKKTNNAIKSDEWYQLLLAECRKYEKEYLRIRSSLSPADQSALEEYISFCLEMEYRRGCIAVELSNTQ